MQFNKTTSKICLAFLCLLCYISTVGLPQNCEATFVMKKILINSKKHGIQECLMDDEDYAFINKWSWKILSHKTKKYAARWDGKNTLLMHRVILKITDPKVLVDHKDLDGLNNQKFNLRKCNKAENNRHVESRKNSSSKYLGVSWDKINKKWTAQITINSKTTHIGRFHKETDAADAYNKKAIEVFGQFANPNKL